MVCKMTLKQICFSLFSPDSSSPHEIINQKSKCRVNFQSLNLHANKLRTATLICTRVNIVVELLPFVEPDFCEARIVVVDDAAGAAGERVGRRLAEHVAHVRTRRDLQPPAAHPHLPVPSHRVSHPSGNQERILLYTYHFFYFRLNFFFILFRSISSLKFGQY